MMGASAGMDPVAHGDRRMQIDRRLSTATLAVAFAITVAACGGSSTPAATSGTGTDATTAPAATEAAPTEAPVATAETTTSEAGGPDVSFAPGQAADLEGMIPDEANGITFVKSSFDGSTLGAAGLPMDAGELQPLLEKYGKSVNDVRVAMATPKDATAGTTTLVMAMQIEGVPAEELLTVVDSSSAGDLKDATVGGKSIRTGGQSPFTVSVYIKDDVLFYILFADDKTLEAVVSKLP